MAWQSGQRPFVPPPAGTPNPVLAAILGLIPGVGAMYNGQFIKGLIHVMIFAVLVSAAHIYGIFGLFIAGWVCYQVFEAYHTAKARRDGDPLPDPFGLNDAANWFGAGGRMNQGMPPAGMPPAVQTGTGPAPNQAQYQPPYEAPFQTPYQTPYQGPQTGPQQGPNVPPGYAGPYVPPIPPIPPVPPIPPIYWRRREPIGAVILIVLGLLILMKQFDWFSGRIFEFSWPVLLIGLGVWMMVRRLSETKVSSQGNSQGGQQ
jgi:TM2 domain-containing membrane protein YozV